MFHSFTLDTIPRVKRLEVMEGQYLNKGYLSPIQGESVFSIWARKMMHVICEDKCLIQSQRRARHGVSMEHGCKECSST